MAAKGSPETTDTVPGVPCGPFELASSCRTCSESDQIAAITAGYDVVRSVFNSPVVNRDIFAQLTGHCPGRKDGICQLVMTASIELTPRQSAGLEASSESQE